MGFSHPFHQNKTVLWFLVINSLQKLITAGKELTTSCISEILLRFVSRAALTMQ